MAAFEYRQAEEIRNKFGRHGMRYLFIGKSGAILLGFLDTRQDAHLFVDRMTGREAAEIERGKGFVELKKGTLDLDLVFAPDGIERFEDAWQRHLEVEGFPVCHIADIIASKAAANRARDPKSLPRLRSFREYSMTQVRQQG